MTQLKAQAIQTALMGNWNNAIALNQLLLEENPDDIDTLNRLAFAYASLGDIKKARDVYQKVLTLDMQNPIAMRNLKRLTNGSIVKVHNGLSTIQTTNLFIEEPGKTKVVELINVADKKVLSPLRSGELLTLSVKRMKIFVLDMQKQYIGMLPDDIGKRLIEFINGGNTYEAYIKTAENNKVIIFVRETKRVKRFQYQSSFTTSETKSKFVLENGSKQAHSRHRKDHDSSDDADESL